MFLRRIVRKNSYFDAGVHYWEQPRRVEMISDHSCRILIKFTCVDGYAQPKLTK